MAEERETDSVMRRREVLKSRISRNACFFDLKALLDLFSHLGIDPENVLFSGYMGTESQPSLVKSVRFHPASEGGDVTVTLYFGLAGAATPLPSYFFQMAQTGMIDEEHFAQLLQFLDQVLIKSWIMALYPECFRTRLGQSDSRPQWLRKVHRLGSLASVHWLFQIMVPELQLRSERGEIVEKNVVSHAQLGKSALGFQMILGHFFSAMAYVHKFTYIADEEFYRYQMPWHQVIQERLHASVFPLLAPLNMNIEVWLVIREARNWLKLESSAYLGYERMRGEENRFKSILIYSGMPQDTGATAI
ncbi:MAG: hypothetical protein RIQ52_646 [Pseudomonadota bacterium]|jgi:hypothetical protein